MYKKWFGIGPKTYTSNFDIEYNILTFGTCLNGNASDRYRENLSCYRRKKFRNVSFLCVYIISCADLIIEKGYKMANYQSVATMCEVTYDSDWYEDDRFITPYRYSLMRNDTESNSDTVSLTLPSYTYYEYLRSLYDCRSTALHRNPPVSMNFGQNAAAEISLPDLYKVRSRGSSNWNHSLHGLLTHG